MNIKHDYSYIGSPAHELMSMGLAELDVHSLVFDRYLTEEEKEENQRQSHILSREQWSKRCDESGRRICNQMTEIAEMLNSKYKMYQYNDDGFIAYNSNWDLFFYSNKGWNSQDYYDHMQISFNSKRQAIENKDLMLEIVSILKDFDAKNVSCRVQYSVRYDEDKITEIANRLCENYLEKFITLGGWIGKIKVVAEQDGIKQYGFFKKGSKKAYYQISTHELVVNYSDKTKTA